jgi:hypothetical protein
MGKWGSGREGGVDNVTRPGARVFPGDGTCDAPGPRAGPSGFSEGLTRAPGRAQALPFFYNKPGRAGRLPGCCPAWSAPLSMSQGIRRVTPAA